MAIPEANASLLFCNRTQEAVEAALGYRDKDHWVSEGWWKIQPGQCSRVLSGALNQRFYFYYAHALVSHYRGKTPHIWSGRYPFCVGTKAFHIEDDQECEENGFKTKDFQEIDIGKTSRDYTLDFKDDSERN